MRDAIEHGPTGRPERFAVPAVQQCATRSSVAHGGLAYLCLAVLRSVTDSIPSAQCRVRAEASRALPLGTMWRSAYRRDDVRTACAPRSASSSAAGLPWPAALEE